jgi:hypothetical protein
LPPPASFGVYFNSLVALIVCAYEKNKQRSKAASFLPPISQAVVFKFYQTSKPFPKGQGKDHQDTSGPTGLHRNHRATDRPMR